MDELARFGSLTRRSYDLAARRYHELFRDELEGKEFDRRLLDRLAGLLPPDSLLLDLGCGPCGHVARRLRGQGHRIVGVDISQACLEVAAREDPSARLAGMDMTRLGLADGSADGVVSYYSVIHAPRRLTRRFFDEFRRVLRPRGKLLVSVKAGDGEGYQEELLGFRTLLYFTGFREADLESCLEGSGFRVLFLESRPPYEDEIPVDRIYAIGEKRGEAG